MQTFLFFLPLLILISGFFLPKTHIKITAFLSLISAIFLSVFYWNSSEIILPSIFKGAFVSFDIVLIIFGALTFLYVMQHLGVISSLEHHLHDLSSDIRIQTILLVWFFGGFLESTAGFGIPALIVAHVLVKIGIPSIAAVVIALAGNSIPVTFGAIGTPIKIGFFNFNQYAIADSTVLIGLFVGIFVPVIILALLTHFLKKPYSFLIEALPFALLSGVCFTIPYYFGLRLGLEFPSLVGSLVGMFLIFMFLKLNILNVKNIHKAKELGELKKKLSARDVFAPYILLIGILLFERLFPIIYVINISDTSTHSLKLFNPGIIFLLVSFIFLLRHKASPKAFIFNIKEALRKIPYPGIIIFLIATTMEILINGSKTDSVFKSLETDFLPIMAPFVGALGAFIAGSATLSNLIFGSIQAHAANQAGFTVSVILSLQLLGATAGNMISIPNIIAAESAVGIKGEEKEIIKKLIPWTIIYILIIILVYQALQYF
ncbi:MAG TPA: L-lactate permease [Patescibacteria group bacterium]|nr:L-lactate permease [Patescibacteria group bacterium]